MAGADEVAGDEGAGEAHGGDEVAGDGRRKPLTASVARWSRTGNISGLSI